MLYVSSSCVRSKSMTDVIKQLAEQGIGNIELSGGTEYCREMEQNLLELKSFYNLQYACHAYFPPPKVPFVINLASCNDQIYKRSEEHYMQCIEMMKHTDCNVLSVHAGFLTEINTDQIGKTLTVEIVYDEEKAYERFCVVYKKLEKLCIANGIKLFLENNVLNTENYKVFGYHNYMMLTDYESMMRLKRQMDFNLLLDLGHLYVSSVTLNLDYEEQCRLLKEHVRWIHISENNGITDEHKPLKRNSKILEAFYNLYNPHIQVTLETLGEIEEILYGYELIDKFMQEMKEKTEKGMKR